MPGQRAGIQQHDLLTGVKVLPVSPGQRADIQTQAILPEEKTQTQKPHLHAGIQAQELPGEVSYSPTPQLADLERALYRAQIYGEVYYAITRDGIPLDTPVWSFPSRRSRPGAGTAHHRTRLPGHRHLRALPPLGAPRATHFYLFCLVSFALYALKYTGELDSLDWTVFWPNVVAEVAAAGAVPAFRAQFPRGAVQEHPPPLAAAADLRARRRPARPLALGH